MSATLIVTGSNRGRVVTVRGEVSLRGWALIAAEMHRKLGTGWILLYAVVKDY